MVGLRGVERPRRSQCTRGRLLSPHVTPTRTFVLAPGIARTPSAAHNLAVGDALLATVLAGSLFALYARPFGIREWQAAAAGAMAATLVGPLSFFQVLDLLAGEWGIFAFFLGLMLIATGAEVSGLYAAATRFLSAYEPGGQLVLPVLLAGAIITAILSNDATPLVLTPAVFVAAAARGTDPRRAAFAVTFVADGASLLLPVSNPVNLLFYERLDPGFSWYATTIFPAALAATAALSLSLRLRPTRSTLAARHPGWIEAAHAPRASAFHTRLALATVGLLAVAYFVAALAGFPLGLVTIAGGLALVVPRLVVGHTTVPAVARSLSPPLFIFIAGLLVLVESATRAGFLAPVGDALEGLASRPVPISVGGAVLFAALLANVMNNWPAALLFAAAIAATPGQPPELVAGALIGCTIGANFTILGSLSTVLWLSLARANGFDVTPAGYARAAFLPTLVALAVASAVALITLSA